MNYPRFRVSGNIARRRLGFSCRSLGFDVDDDDDVHMDGMESMGLRQAGRQQLILLSLTSLSDY